MLRPQGYTFEEIAGATIGEIAGWLGVGRPDPTDDAPDTSSSGRSRAIERLRADAEGRPAPEPSTPDQSLVALMAQGQVG